MGPHSVVHDPSRGKEGEPAASSRDILDPSRRMLLRLPDAGLADLSAIRAFVAHGSRQLGADDACAADLIQAVDESVTNVIRHGYLGLRGPVDIEIGREAEAVRVDVRDEAPGFDPRTWSEPDLDVPLLERRPGGFGIHLTRACVDRLEHTFLAPAGNQLTLFRRVDPTPQEDPA